MRGPTDFSHTQFNTLELDMPNPCRSPLNGPSASNAKKKLCSGQGFPKVVVEDAEIAINKLHVLGVSEVRFRLGSVLWERPNGRQDSWRSAMCRFKSKS